MRQQGWAISLGEGEFHLYSSSDYNERVSTTPKLLFFFSVLSILILKGVTSCKPDTGSSDGMKKVAQLAVDWSKGDCIDRPLSPYIYQISAIEGNKVYLYRMGEMGKKVVEKTVDQLKEGTEPFQKIPCP